MCSIWLKGGSTASLSVIVHGQLEQKKNDIYIFILVVNIFQVALQTKTLKLSYILSPLFLQGEGEDEHHGVWQNLPGGQHMEACFDEVSRWQYGVRPAKINP